jgi:hypothetical protein
MKHLKAAAILTAVSLFIPSLSSAFDLSLRISSGLGWLKAAEVNSALAGWREGWKLKTEIDPNMSLESESSGPLHLGIDFETELLFSFSRWLGVGVSAGYAFASRDEKQTLLSISQKGILYDYARPTKISAYPIFLSLYAMLPLGQKFRAYLRGGLGSIRTTYVVREANKKAEAPRFSYSVYNNAKASCRGYLGSLGLSYAFDQSLGFFIEAMVRSARVSGFEGEDMLGVKGRLYAYEEYRPDIDFWQSRTSLLPEEPGGETIRNVREATVDFSGYSARIGLFLKF